MVALCISHFYHPFNRPSWSSWIQEHRREAKKANQNEEQNTSLEASHHDKDTQVRPSYEDSKLNDDIKILIENFPMNIRQSLFHRLGGLNQPLPEMGMTVMQPLFTATVEHSLHLTVDLKSFFVDQ